MEQPQHSTTDQPKSPSLGPLPYALLTWLSASAIAVASSLWQRSSLPPSAYGFVFLAPPPVWGVKVAWYLATCALAGVIVRWCDPRQAWVVATFVALSAALPLLVPARAIVVPSGSALSWLLGDQWMPYLDKAILGLGLVLAARLAYRRAGQAE